MWILMSSIGSTVVKLIRVDKFLIIKDTNCKIVELIGQPFMNRVYQLFP